MISGLLRAGLNELGGKMRSRNAMDLDMEFSSISCSVMSDMEITVHKICSKF